MKKSIKLILIACMVLMMSSCFGIRAYADEGNPAPDAFGNENQAGNEGNNAPDVSEPGEGQGWDDPEPTEPEASEPETVETVEEVTADTVVVNAIQAQVDEAIANLSSTGTDQYVRIEEGSYEGNINISMPTPQESIQTPQESIQTPQENTTNNGADAKLYLLAPGSYTETEAGAVENIGAGADGNTTMNGDVYIDGINVVLAGIYFSMGNTIEVKKSTTEIFGTTQDDNITLDVEKDGKATVATGEGADTIKVMTEDPVVPTDGAVTNSGSKSVTLEGGEGADVYEIDLSVGGDEHPVSSGSDENADPTEITINGDEADRVHLSGDLNTASIDTTMHDSDDTVVAGQTYAQVTDAAKQEYTVNLIADKDSQPGLHTVVKSKGVASFTDELGKKKEVTVTANDIDSKITDDCFTNYKYIPAENETVALTVAQAAAQEAAKGMFNQLVVGRAKQPVKIGSINTNGMNLMIIGDSVDISGDINAGVGDVLVRAADDDFNIDLSGVVPKNIAEYLPDSVKKPLNKKYSVFSIKSKANINLSEKKSISANNVDLRSSSKQNQPLVPTDLNAALKGLDFVAVKIGEAVMNLSGNINATNAIMSKASSAITAKASNENVAKWFIPLAAAVLLGEAGVLANKTAAFTARAIKLLSESKVDLSISSTVGAVPISMAVAAVTNDSYVRIEDYAEMSPTETFSAVSDGKLIATTKSHARNKETADDANNKAANSDSSADTGKGSNLYGGFIAVSVAIQNVATKVLGEAAIKSEANGKHISLRSDAFESVVTTAVGSVPKTTPKKDGSADSGNGNVATNTDTKSSADNSDNRSVANTKDNVGNVLDATKSDKVTQKGKSIDDKDRNKIDKLSGKVKGSEKNGNSNDNDEEEGSLGLDKLFDESAGSADVKDDKSSQDKKKSSLQLAGAFAVNVVTNRVMTLVCTVGEIASTSGIINIFSNGMTYSKAVANSQKVTDDNSDSGHNRNALGAAVAVNVTKAYTTADIRSGFISADKVNVFAQTGGGIDTPVTVHTEAVAGFSDGDNYGIAGAVAVDVTSIKTLAHAGGDYGDFAATKGLTVKSRADEDIKTIATTNVAVKNSTGVGVAIATAVNGIDTIASTGYESNPCMLKDDYSSVTVDATNELKEEVSATSGAKAKNGVSPAITVDVSGVHTESIAYIAPASTALNLPGDYTVNANSNANRSVSADASSSAEAGSFAGTVVVSVINDSANATSKSDIKANNIKVNAVSKSKLAKSKARASSQGAKKTENQGSSDDSSGDGDQDKQAGEAISGAQELSKDSDSKNVNSNSVEELTKDRQKAQTAEGTVSVAAAFVVNVMKNSAVAALLGNAVSATDAISVTSTNLTDVYAFADASATTAKSNDDGTVVQNNKVGVGAAVAINVLTIDNKAYIETNSEIKAKSITVKASGDKKTEGEGEEAQEQDVPNTIRVYSVSGAGAAGVGVAGSVAISRTGGDIDAYITCARNGQYKNVTATDGNIEVIAKIDQDEQIISSASLLKNDKKPDNNDDGKEKEAQEDSKKAEDGITAAKTIDADKTNKGQEDKSPTANEDPKKDGNKNAKNPDDKGTADTEATAVGVGASFTLNVSSLTTKAYIDAARVTAGKTINVSAEEEIVRKLFAVAGTDPFAKGAVANKGVDAAVSINISNDNVTAYTEKNSMVTAGGAFNESSKHSAKTRVKASGFAVGKQAAVGASVALNISNGTTESRFVGEATAAGVSITSKTEDEDFSTSLASAMGTTEDKSKESSSKQPGDTNNNNKTATEINKALNDNKSESAKSDASNSKAVSTNLLNTQDAKTESTQKDSKVGKEIKAAEDEANKEAGPAAGKDKAGTDKFEDGTTGTPETKIAVAATVGINITNHAAKTIINANINGNGKDITLKAENSSQYSALGTGLTMTQFPGTATVAAGVAIAINKNQALVQIADGKKITSVKTAADNDDDDDDDDDDERGDIEISAEMNNNASNAYMGAQAVSGSIARKSSTDQNQGKVNVSGAVAILITRVKVNTTLGKAVVLDGGDISIEAEEEYKLHVRAGSLGYATKTNVGVGASFAMLYVNDDVQAIVGDNTSINGTSIKVESKRKNDDLMKQLDGLLKYITMGATVYNAFTEDKVVKAKESEGGDKSVEVSQPDLKSIETIGAAFNVINLFIKDSYHIEAFSGSYVGGNGKLNAGGAVSLGFLNSTVRSQIGQNVKLITVKGADKSNSANSGTKDKKAESTDIEISATDDSVGGFYSIGVLAGSAKTSAGGSIAVIINNGTVEAKVLNNLKVDVADGLFKVNASSKDSNVLATTAASVTSGGVGVGGNVNVYINKVNTLAEVASGSDIKAQKDITVLAQSGGDDLLIVGGVQGGKGTAAGGTVSISVFNGNTIANVLESKLRSESGNIVIKAHSDESVVSILASASAAIKSSPSVAAVIDIKVAKSLIKAYAKALNIMAPKGDISILADTRSKLTTIDAALAFSLGSVAVGGIVAVNVMKRTIQALIEGGAVISAGGNVLLSALADGGAVKVIASGQAGGNSFGGVVAVDVENNKIEAGNFDGRKSSISADGSIGISALADILTNLIIGQVNGALTTGIGGVISVSIINNTINARHFGDLAGRGGKILALPSMSQGAGSDGKRRIRGVAVDASENKKYNSISVAGAGAASVAISGVIKTIIVSSKIKAEIKEGSTVKAERTDGASDDGSVPLAIEVVAYDVTNMIVAAGTLNGAGSVAIGATVVVITYSGTIDALMNANSVTLKTAGKEGTVRVQAYNLDKLFIVAGGIAVSGATSVAAAPVVIVYQNTSNALLNSASVIADTKNTKNANGEPDRESVLVRSDALSDLVLFNVMLSASGSAAVSPALSVVYFYNSSTARIIKSEIKCGSLATLSNTREKIFVVDIGAAGSGAVAVGAAVTVIITRVVSEAYTDSTNITARKDNGSFTSRVRIAALDNYELKSIAASLGGSGTTGVGASILVAVMHNRINAYAGDSVNIDTQDAFILLADSNRNIAGYSLSVGASGVVGVGAAVVVVVAGTGIDKDSYDAIHKDAKLDPGMSLSNAFGRVDKRAAQTAGKDTLVRDLNKSLSANREDAHSVAKKIAPDGDFKKMRNDFSDATGETVSAKLDGKISDSSDGIFATVKKANIKAASVTIRARENINTLLVTGAIGAGIATAGVGAGITVALVTSNVLATVEDDAVITSTDFDIVVCSELSHALNNMSTKDLTLRFNGKEYKAEPLIKKAIETEKSRSDSIKSLADYGMLLVAGAGGAGFVGVAANVAYYNNSAVVKSVIRGTLKSATDKAYYNIVKASIASVDPKQIAQNQDSLSRTGVFTVSVSGGLVGASVTVALATINADVSAGFESSKPKTIDLNASAVFIYADTKLDLIAINGTCGIGAVGATVLVSIVNNKINQRAYIGEHYGFDFKDKNHRGLSNKLTSNIKSNLESYFGSLAAGAIGTGVTVIIANNKAKNTVSVSTSDTDIRLHDLKLRGAIEGVTKVIGAMVAGGAIAGNVAVVLALQTSSNNVIIKNTSLYIKGDIEIIGAMSGHVKCDVGSLNVGAIGVGVTVALSLAKSSHIVSLYISKGKKLEANHITVAAGDIFTHTDPYDVTATTTMVAGQAGGITGGTNYCYASNKVVSDVLVDVNGNFKAGWLTIQSRSLSKALAVAVNAALGAVGGNSTYVKAVVDATVKAAFNVKGSPSIELRSLEVIAYHNSEGTSPIGVSLRAKLTDEIGIKFFTVRPEAAADARLYAGGIAAGTIGASSATSSFNATVLATVNIGNATGSIGTTYDDLNVKVRGASTAYANAANAALTLAEFGAVSTKAEAIGTFKATFVDNNKQIAIRANHVNVINEFAGKANALTEPSPQGIKARLAGISGNEAISNVSITSEASIRAQLKDEILNSNVTSTGSVESHARIIGTTINITGVQLGTDKVDAKAVVSNNAYFSNNNEVVFKPRTFNVLAILKRVDVQARGGASVSGTSVKLVGSGITTISAISDITNIATVDDSDVEAKETIRVRADVAKLDDDTGLSKGNAVKVEAVSDAPKYDINVVNGQAVRTSVNSDSTVKVVIKGRTNLISAQSDFIAADNTIVTSTGSAPQVSVTVVSGESVYVISQAARKRERIVETVIDPDVYIMTTGIHSSTELENIHKKKPLIDNVTLRALSNLDVYAKLNDMKNYSGIKLGGYNLGTDIGDVSANVRYYGVIETSGDVIILAENRIQSLNNDLKAINAGLIGAGTSTNSGSIASQNALVELGSKDNHPESAIKASLGNVSINAVTAVKMRSVIESSDYGLGTRSSINASNTVKRNTTINVTGIQILAAGNIGIYADAQPAEIISKATGSAGGAAQKALPTARIDYVEKTSVITNKLNKITAQLGAADVIAQSASDLNSYTEYTMTGGIESNRPISVINSTVDVIVNLAKKSGKATSIFAADTTIAAYIKMQKHIATSRAITKSFATFTEAKSEITSKNKILVDIGNAIISGYETIGIYALAEDLYEDAVSYGSITGVTGKVYSHSKIEGGTSGLINLGNSDKYMATLAGPDITVMNGFDRNFSVDNNIRRDATASGNTIIKKVTQKIQEVTNVVDKVTSWMPWPFKNVVRYVTRKVVKWVTKVIDVVTYSDAMTYKEGTYKVDGQVNVNANLYSGEFAAGITILIDKDKKVTTTGIPKADISKYIVVDRDGIILHDLKETKQGKFTINAYDQKASGTLRLYNSAYVSSLTIDNYSGLPLYIRDVYLVETVERTKQELEKNPPIILRMPEGVKLKFAPASYCNVSINTHGSDIIFQEGIIAGKVQFMDFDAGQGRIDINLEGGNAYTQGSAFIAANRVMINNAKVIGNTDNSGKFNVRVFAVAPVNSDNIYAEGRSGAISFSGEKALISITPVRMYYKASEKDAQYADIRLPNIECDYVDMYLAPRLYTSMVKSDSIIGTDRVRKSIRDYGLYGRLVARYWFVDVRADRMIIAAEKDERINHDRGYYDRQRFRVLDRNLTLINFTLSIYTPGDDDDDPDEDDQDRDSDGGPASNYQPQTNIYTMRTNINKEYQMLRQRDKRVFRDNVNTIPKRSNVSSGLYRKYANKAGELKVKRVSMRDTILKNFRIWSDMDDYGSVIALFDNAYTDYDLILINDYDGWSILITAVYPEVAGIMTELGSTLNGEISIVSALKDAVRNQSYEILGLLAVTKAWKGFNYLYILIPSTVLMLLFLILTRKKKDEEEN